MSSQAAAPMTKARGTGFPSLPLDEAALAVKTAGKHGREHALAAFAAYMGHETATSGAFRAKMASLKDFGLIERPSPDRVLLTEIAHQLAHPSSASEEQRLLQEAFFSAAPFKSIYTDSAKETDLSLEFVGNRAVTGLHVGAPNKQRFADSFARSVVAAGLGHISSKGSVFLQPPGPATDLDNAVAGDGREEQARRSTVSSEGGSPGGRVTTQSTPPTIHQSWLVAGGSVLFEVRLDDPLPGTAFQLLAGVMAAVEEFVAGLGKVSVAPPDPSAAESADGAAE